MRFRSVLCAHSSLTVNAAVAEPAADAAAHPEFGEAVEGDRAGLIGGPSAGRRRAAGGLLALELGLPENFSSGTDEFGRWWRSYLGKQRQPTGET
ncbi:hypothetical protein ACFVX9_13205 [Kitasatospora sp. NPDC058243]|uniref:hypothetical protein n=1 Tax=Kitasatospora sp. NPDC058243 TaxID=3346397 RepID=UPI0036DA31EE